MGVYTVHLPRRGAPPNLAALIAAVFVPEGFSRAAFFLGPFWLAWHRLWLELLVWIVVFLLLGSGALHFMGAWTSFFIAVLLEILLGLEGNNLRRGDLARHGYRLADVAAGASQDDAERGFFRRVHESAPQPSVKPPPLSPPPEPQTDVLGIFPLPEDPR